MARVMLVLAVAWTVLIAVAWWQTSERRQNQARRYAIAQARVVAQSDLTLHSAGLPSGRDGGYGSIHVRWKGVEGTPGSTAPDHWEYGALAKLLEGAPEVQEAVHQFGDRHLRWMGPVLADDSCVGCHAEIDPRDPRVRGGISVSMPLDPILAVSKGAWEKQAWAHGIAWLLGLGALALGYSGLVRGLAERDRVMRNLETALEANETIIGSVPFGMIIVGRDKVVRHVNRVAERMLSKSADDIVGRICNETFCPSRADSCPILDLGQTLDEAERQVRDVDGNLISVHKSVLPITWQGEEALLEAFIDLSEHTKVLDDQKALLAEEQRLTRLATGRELRMVQLKQEINQLLEELGRPARFRSTEVRAGTTDPAVPTPGGLTS